MILYGYGRLWDLDKLGESLVFQVVLCFCIYSFIGWFSEGFLVTKYYLFFCINIQILYFSFFSFFRNLKILVEFNYSFLYFGILYFICEVICVF